MADAAPIQADADAPVAGTSLWKDALKRLRRNSLAVFGFWVVTIVVVASIAGPPIIERTTGYTYDYIPSSPGLINSFPPFTAPDGSFSREASCCCSSRARCWVTSFVSCSCNR